MYKKLFFSLKIVLAGVIFWLLMRHSQLKLSLFVTIFENPFSTALIILLCYAMVVLHAWRWCRLNVVQGIKLSFKKTLMPAYIGIAFNLVLPGSVGGDFVRLYYVLKKFPQQKSHAIFAIVVDRLIGLISVFLIACLLAPLYFQTFRYNNDLSYLLQVCLVICAVSMVFVGLCLWVASEKTGIYHFVMRKANQSKLAKTLHFLFDAIRNYKNSKLIVLEALIASILTQLLLLVVVVIICKMMNLPMLSLMDYMLALVIAQVANLVPLTPGGIGLGEAAFANVLLIIHPDVNAAYATIFLALRLLSIISYLPGVLIGIFGYHLLDRNREDGKSRSFMFG